MAIQQPFTAQRPPPHAADYEPLRIEGLGWLQALGGARWSDHNRHDPGITMLESLCFALAALAYRADFPVADLLCSPDGRIHYERLGLHAPQQVFPARATTADDFCRVLLDRVDGVAGVSLAPVLQGPLQGLYRLTVEAVADADASAACRQAQALFMAERALGEDLDGPVRPMRPLWCSLQAQLDIEGGRDALDIAAEVLHACAEHLAAPVALVAADDLLHAGWPLERIYRGPELRHGVIDDAALRQQRQEFLFVGDVLERVRAVDGVRGVRWLAMQPDGGAPATGLLRWRDAANGQVLRLRLPDDPLDEGRLQMWRRGLPIDLPSAALRHRVQALRREHQARRRAASAAPFEPAQPQGRWRPARRPAPVQDLLPPLYGVNAEGVPASAGAERLAQAQQLRAYLALFQQHLAHGEAQLAHLPELFATDAQSRSYAWHTLDDAAVHGLAALLRPDPERAHAELERAWLRFDAGAERKSRLLDHLLALHGLSWPQNTLRHSWTYLDDDEVEHALLQAKAALMQDVLRINRDRAAGADLTQPMWDSADNISGLQRQVGHLLGLRSAATRALTAPLSEHGRALADDAAQAGSTLEPPGGLRLVLDRDWQAGDAATLRAAALQMAPLRGRNLPGPLLRAGLYRDRYLWAPGGADGRQLVLGPDEQGRWWPLAGCASERDAVQAAQGLRHLLLEIDQASEGLHVVEHLLLRPLERPADRPADCPADSPTAAEQAFFSGRVSVLLPAWPERFSRPGFRAFAEETVALACPAHLHAACLWLPFEAMQRFEAMYRQWLDAQRAHRLGEGDARACDDAAATLVALLVALPPGAQEPGDVG